MLVAKQKGACTLAVPAGGTSSGANHFPLSAPTNLKKQTGAEESSRSGARRVVALAVEPATALAGAYAVSSSEPGAESGRFSAAAEAPQGGSGGAEKTGGDHGGNSDIGHDGRPERRARGVRRMPMERVVDVCGLMPGAPNFQALSVNVSGRGIQLRSRFLPEVETPVVLRFLQEGTEVVAEGEVAWRRRAGEEGEFGVRFTALDVQSATVLQSLGAPSPARVSETVETRSQPGPLEVAAVEVTVDGPAEAGARVGDRVDLLLDGLDAPLPAEVTDVQGDSVYVCTELPFLTIGAPGELAGERSAARPMRVEAVQLGVHPQTRTAELYVALRDSSAKIRPVARRAASRGLPFVGQQPAGASGLCEQSEGQPVAWVRCKSTLGLAGTSGSLGVVSEGASVARRVEKPAPPPRSRGEGPAAEGGGRGAGEVPRAGSVEARAPSVVIAPDVVTSSPGGAGAAEQVLPTSSAAGPSAQAGLGAAGAAGEPGDDDLATGGALGRITAGLGQWLKGLGGVSAKPVRRQSGSAGRPREGGARRSDYVTRRAEPAEKRRTAAAPPPTRTGALGAPPAKLVFGQTPSIPVEVYPEESGEPSRIGRWIVAGAVVTALSAVYFTRRAEPEVAAPALRSTARSEAGAEVKSRRASVTPAPAAVAERARQASEDKEEKIGEEDQVEADEAAAPEAERRLGRGEESRPAAERPSRREATAVDEAPSGRGRSATEAPAGARGRQPDRMREWVKGPLHLPVVHRLKLDRPGRSMRVDPTPTGFEIFVFGSHLSGSAQAIGERDARVAHVQAVQDGEDTQISFRFSGPVPGHRIRLNDSELEVALSATP